MLGFLSHFNVFRTVKADRRRKKMLDDARSQLADAVANKEYYDAIVPMLRKRVYRLEQEITKATKVAR